MTDTPYSPQDFAVVNRELNRQQYALGDHDEGTHEATAALSRIKAHTEGLTEERDKYDGIAQVYMENAVAAEARIAELEAGLREMEANFRSVMFRHHSGRVDDDCAHNLREVERLRSLLSPKPPTDPVTFSMKTARHDPKFCVLCISGEGHKSADTPSEEGGHEASE